MDALGKLGLNLGYMITQIINLLLMIVLLWVVAFKPIVRMLKQRRERIAEGLNNARRAEEALASAESDKQAILDEARAEGQRIVNEARTRAEEVARTVEDEARADATRIREQAELDARAERDRLLSEMRDQIVALSLAAAQHLIGESLRGDERRQRQLVEEFFTQVPPEAKHLGDGLVVITAVPLTDREQKRIKNELGAADVEFVTDPGILGGVVVRASGAEVDGSFARQLADMRTALA